MLQIGESMYRLVGLDTNAVSEILLDGDRARRGFLSLFAGGYVPCFSVYSLFELRRRTEIYEEFVEFFDVYPCLLLKNEEQLFQDEQAAYPTAEGIDPTAMGFSVLNTKHGTNLKNVMAISFENPDTLRREQEWPNLKQALLSEWVALRRNFPPKGRRYITPDATRFVREATPQHATFRAPEWVREMQDSGHTVSHTGFPSVRMTLWTIFFRLYMAERRTPETQDVFDALISAPAPYLDAVVTENFQADIYEKVKKLDPAVSHLDVYTLKDLRTTA